MKKTLIGLLAVLLLSGCTMSMNPHDIRKAQETCTSRDTQLFSVAYSNYTESVTVVCQNNLKIRLDAEEWKKL